MWYEKVCKSTVAAIMLSLAVTTASAQLITRPPLTAAKSKISPKVVDAASLGVVQNQSLRQLSALCESEGKMYGARPGDVAVLGEDGSIVRTIRTGITKVAGISSYKPGLLLVGDAAGRSIQTVNLKTGQTSRLLLLSNVKTEGFPTGTLLRDSELMSVGSDGTNIFVGISAGFSSSIFKIDPVSQRVLAHGWAPGDNPSALVFQNGNLFVLESKGKQIRKLDTNLKPNFNYINVPVTDGKGLIIRGEEIRILSPTQSSITRLKADVKVIATPTPSLKLADVKVLAPDRMLPLVGQKYAVLICGDHAESCYYCDSFWNDTVWMYKTLLSAGYTPENIYVLYANGTDYISANPKYRHSTTVTDFAATPTWVTNVFNGLKNGDAARGIKKMTDRDTLFLWTFDHGSGGDPAYLCLFGGDMVDTQFASLVNAVPYSRRAIFMQQCRSGGFIDNLRNNKTFISTACQWNENSHAADTENEMYNGKKYYHGEYNYHIISAIAKLTPTNTVINADANSNSVVSALEAHQWNVSRESRSETPAMNDMGGVGAAYHIR